MSSPHEAVRYHDICAGHRVAGHENKCRHLHGHNYRVWFHCRADSLDKVGRVLDFAEIKVRLCYWLEDNWDHHFLVWKEDVWAEHLRVIDKSVVLVPFNPTAENMAQYLVEKVGPARLAGTGIKLVKVTVEETRKCSATYTLPEEMIHG